MFIAETNSTNDYLHGHQDVDIVRTDYQCAGRGQLGNSWESERGKNLLFSMRWRNVPLLATQQWQWNMLVALALYRTIYALQPSGLSVKWPNDLYYQDRKLAGILIENTLCGNRLQESVVGIGLNLNQTEWKSDAPNPVSLKQITGNDYDAGSVMQQLVNHLSELVAATDDCKNEYMSVLYRRDGWHYWEEREVDLTPTMNAQRSNQSFEAKISDITDCGELVLEKRNGEKKTYHFKQIKYII